MSFQKTLYKKTAFGILKNATVETMNAGNVEIVVDLETPYGDHWLIKNEHNSDNVSYGICLYNSGFCLNNAILEHTKTSEALLDNLLAEVQKQYKKNEAIEITKEDICEEFAKVVSIVVSICGQGCNYETKKGVEGFQVDFDVKIAGKEYHVVFQKECHVVFQSAERNDNIMAYHGCEMEPAQLYGVDSDESELLEEKDLETLRERAVALCEEWLKENNILL